jgi:hypothetical protein
MRLRLHVVPVFILFFLAFDLAAATTEIRALLDLDNDVVTGCTVMTVDGPFAGVEMIHETTVTTSGGMPSVMAISYRLCIDAGTGTFGSPVAINSPWTPPLAVGLGNGIGGAYVVESYLPLSGVATTGTIRVGFETGSPVLGGLDALLSDGGAPMMFVAFLTADIPTLSEWALILLGLILMASAIVMMRRHPQARPLMMIVLLVGVATVAYAAGFVPDGSTDDWTGEPALGQDGLGDAPSADLAAVFARGEGGIAFFRYDMANFANTDPVADDQSVATSQDTPIAIALTGSDADGDALTFAVATNPASGVLTGTAPNLTYTPNAGFTGNDSFTFTVNDGTVDSAPATVSITVNAPGNTAPVANAQSVTTDQDTPVAITLTGSDPDGDAITFTVTTNPTSGVLTGTAPNLTYTPNAGFTGNDSFTFTVNDGTVDSAPATVFITVNAPGNTVPVANDQSVTTEQDSVVAIVLTGSDPDGDPITFTVTKNPTSGVLTGAAPNLTYTPNAGFTGNDSFTFTVNDGTVDSPAATVSITVNAPGNTAPAAHDQTVTTTLEVAVAITLTGSDPDGDAITFTVATNPTSGVLTGTAPNLTYTPNAGFTGNDSFTFVVNDGTVDSAPASVSITVNAPGNTAPVADSQSVTTTRDAAVAIALTGSDPDGDTITFSLISTPANGTLTGTIPNLTYTPAPGFTGNDSFTFVVNDGTVDSAPATVSITVNAPDNSIPVATDDNYSTDEDVTLNVATPGVLANDTDADGDTLTATLVSSTLHGALTLEADGSFTYVPAPAFFGTDSFTYRASDGTVESNTATVTITIEPVNDPPSFTKGADQTIDSTGGGVRTIAGWASNLSPGPANESDQTLTFVVTGNDNAALFATGPAISGTSGDLTFTPVADAQGVATITIVLRDDGGTARGGIDTSAPQSFTIQMDAAPRVISTVPSAGAAVSPTSTITINFNENVEATVASFELHCPAATPVAFTLSASPASSFTLTPAASLPPGVECQVRVLASEISDVDAFDPPDQMSADHQFTFMVAAGGAATSTISADPSSIVADGVSTSQITVQLKDGDGNDLTTSGGVVTLSTTDGTLSTVTDHNDGTYTATLTSSTTAGAVTVSGTINGSPMVDTAAVSFTAGAAAKYLVSSSDSSPAAGSSVTITAQLADANDNPVATENVTVNWSSTSGGSFGAATSLTDASGVATVTFTTSTTAGTVHAVTADDGSFTGTSADITTTTGAAAKYLVSSSDSSPAAGSSVTITAQLVDASDNPVATENVTVNWSSTNGGLFGSPSSLTNASGVATVTFTTSTTAGTVHTVTADDTTNSGTSADITTVVGGVSLSGTTITADPVSIVADGASASTITVQLRDQHGNAIGSSGGAVVLTTTAGDLDNGVDNGASVTAIDNADGTYTATLISPTTSGSATISGTLAGDALTGTASVTFTHGALASFVVEAFGGGAIGTQQTDIAFAIQITAVDANGNTVESFDGTVDISSTTATFASGGGTTAAFTSGVLASHSVTISNGGTHQIIATRTGDIETGTSNSFLVDAPPTVVSTVPAGDAVDVAVTTTITVNFSESVTATTDSFDIRCPASNLTAHAYTLSAGPASSYTLTPTSNLPGGTTCQVTVFGAEIVDDALFTMEADHVFSFSTAPVAANDTYPQTVVGNVRIDSNRITYSVLDNDEFDGTATISAFDATTTGGGTVTMTTSGAGVGEFTYQPAPGFEGNDTFTYTLSVGGSTATATVTIPVSGMIWFVNSAAAAGGNGTLAAPFNCLIGEGCFNGSANEAGDNIFLYAGSYAAGLTLKNNQKLIGQGSSSATTLAAIAGVTVPSSSDALPVLSGNQSTVTISGGADGVTLGQGNTVRGLTIGNTPAFVGLRGDGFGTVSISEVTVNGTGGVANLNNGSFGAGAALTSATSTSSPGAGLSLTGIATGTLTIGSTSISGSTSQGIVFTGSGATVSFGNTTVSPGTIGLQLAANSGSASFGTLSISGGSGIGLSHDGGGSLSVTGATTITNPGGTGIDIRSLALATPVSFAATTVNKGATTGTGVNLGGGATGNAGNVTFASLAITTSNGTALLGVNNTGSITVTTNGGSISATGGPAVDITKAAAPFTPVTLNFANSSSTGGVNAVRLQNLSGSANLGGGNLTGTAGGAAFLISGGTIGTTYTGGITQAANNALVSVINHSSGTIAFSTGTLSATGGTGLQFSNADGTYNFNGTTTLNGGDAGIDIVSGSDGTFSFSAATSITHSTNAGHAFVLDASNANITYGGTVTDNSGRAISINNHDGGSITFNGAISASGAGANGIHITNSNNSGSITFNGAVTLSTQGNAAVTLTGNTGKTIAFAGGLAITTTTGAGFTATGGGTVSATQNNTTIVNTITAGTGTALNVQNTTIGAAGLTFRSISSNGALSGIVLNATGALGGLTVSGNGGAGTGGVINASTGAGIQLINTRSSMLSWMNVTNGQDDGISADIVTGLSLDRMIVSGNGNGPGENGIDLGNSAISPDSGFSGAISITNSTITNSYSNNIYLGTNSGALTFTVTGNSISGNSVAGDDGLLMVVKGSANVGATISGNTFAAHRGDHFQAVLGNDAGLSGTARLKFLSNTLSGGHGNPLGQGITIGATGQGPSWSGRLDYDIDDNTINGSISHAITVNLGVSTTTAVSNGFIRNNRIGTAATSASGSVQGNGIDLSSNGSGTHTAAVSGNTIRQVYDRGIAFLANDASINSVSNVTIQSNTVVVGTFDITGSREPIYINAGSFDPNFEGVVDAPLVRLNILSNTLTNGVNVTDDIRVRARFDSRVEFLDYGGAANDSTAVQTYLNGRNPGNTSLVSTVAPYVAVSPGGRTDDGLYGTVSVPLPTSF